MFTEIHYPNHLTPKELDQYLAKSWFRMGQMIFTCQFLCFGGALYSAVWTRLLLENYQFRKGLRKLIKRNGDRFKVVVRRAVFNHEKEMLYQVHKSRFEGYVAGSLKESLFGDADYNIYDTWEICIYDQYQLVAVSFFDKGENSLASIMGLFDPGYQKYSLGFYTMLLEIIVGIEEGKKYYYPGYVVPGYGRFDYKLRVGNVEYFDPRNKSWKSYSTFDFDHLPSTYLKQKLALIQKELELNKIANKQILYPLYDKELYGQEGKDFLKNPMFISCFHHPANPMLLIIEYDLFEDVYRLSRASKYEDTLSYLIYLLFEGFDEEKSYLEFLSRDLVIAESSSITKIINIVLESTSHLKRYIRKKGEM